MKDKYKTLITACWIVLICCFIVKLLGGNWFEIACNNEKFIAFCNTYKNTIIEYIIGFITYTTTATLYYLALFKRKWYVKKDIIWIVLISIFAIVKRIFIKYQLLLGLTEILIIIGFPIILDIKKWYRPIIAYGLTFVFQLISLLTKNIGIKVIDDNFIVSLIFSIDYYIMLILYYLYANKEEQNGCIWVYFSRFRKRRND